MPSFKDNVVLLAGASRGIGEQIAYRLAGQRARLIVSARSADRLEVVAEECRARGAQAVAIPADVTDEAACRSLVERAAQTWGRIDTLMYNAGGGDARRFDSLPDLSGAQAEMDLNYFGLVRCVRYALPHLRQARGRIVATSSMGGRIGLPGTATYNAAKHAMRGFLSSLRVELLGTGVSVTVVHLSAVRTEGFLRRLGSRAGDVPSTSPEQAAASIIRAGAARQREAIPAPEGRLLALVYPLMPGLIDRALARQVGALYEDSPEG